MSFLMSANEMSNTKNLSNFKSPIPDDDKGKHTDDLIDHYWGTISYISNLIRASEVKAGLILSFYGIVLSFIFQGIDSMIEQSKFLNVMGVLAFICLVCVGLSIYHSVKCFMPKLETKFDDNVFFFSDVINKYGDINSFSQNFLEVSIDGDRLFLQLGHQIYINSLIADYKFKTVNRSLQFLGFSFYLFLGILGLHFYWVVI